MRVSLGGDESVWLDSIQGEINTSYLSKLTSYMHEWCT